MTRSPLRCVVLAVGDFPEGGAVSQRLYLLARILKEGLGEASLWLLHPSSKKQIPQNREVAGEKGGVDFIYLSGRTVRPSGLAGALVDTVRGIYSSIRSIAARRGVRPDVLVVYTPRLLKFILPIMVARLFRVHVIAEICEIHSRTTGTTGRGMIRRWVNSGEALMEWLIPRLASGAIVISTRIQQYYARLGMHADRMLLVPALIEYSQYCSGGADPVSRLEGMDFLLNSGSFKEKDGLEYVVKAVQEARRTVPGLHLVFTGQAAPDAQKGVLSHAGEDAKDWIIFTGFLSRESLIWCYKHAAGLLSCRSNSDYANYGFPTKLAEYLATGTPVVVTDVGDVRNYLNDDSAFIAEPENIGSIARAMTGLLGDRPAARRVGKRGQEVARKYFDYVNRVEPVADFIRRRIRHDS
jgi:glycosyltransferase involved in cell wall biosynthesis